MIDLRSQINMFQIMLINVLDRRASFLATVDAMFWMCLVMSKKRCFLAIPEEKYRKGL